jgi:hypothetical protein
MSTLNCPHCGQIDKVQKVSALFSQGTSHTSYETPSAAVRIKDTTFYGTQEHTAISRTALSQRLMPPSQPDIQRPKKNLGVTNKLVGYRNAGIGCILSLVIGIAGMYIAGRVDGTTSLLTWCGDIGIALILIMTFVSIKQIVSIAKGNESKEHYEVEMDWYNRKIREYENAQRRWDSAYYCGRCDGVFIPGLGDLKPINEFDRFLNK